METGGKINKQLTIRKYDECMKISHISLMIISELFAAWFPEHVKKLINSNGGRHNSKPCSLMLLVSVTCLSHSDANLVGTLPVKSGLNCHLEILHLELYPKDINMQNTHT